MTISVWRYSHLALAVSSFLFIALASVTGIILAFEPVSQKVQSYRSADFNALDVAETIPVLKKQYPEIIDVTIDKNQFVLVKAIDESGKNVSFYADPKTGKSVGEAPKKNAFFQWITTLHRSLFLHETGRIFVGITAFLLFLIAISGTILVIRRQRGVKRFFTKIVKENFAQYYHVVLGRMALIPILIITLTGVYLSLVRFKIIPEQKISHDIDFDTMQTKPVKKFADFSVFKNTPLSEVQSIEFPFSDDPEDYFTLKLYDREIVVNQITGDVISDIPYTKTALLTDLSLNLHTGRASGIWAVILAIASVNILFFIYSGFAMTLKRRENRIRNKFSKDDATFIILVGSENGSTLRFANAIHQQLLKNGQKSMITQLNEYTIFPKAEQFLVFTATYGLGEAPTNASKFINLLEKNPQSQPVQFSVIGFGSKSYPDFCQFAHEVNNALSAQEWAIPLLEIHTVNDKSPSDFEKWATLWSQKTQTTLTITPDFFDTKPKRFQQFIVTAKTPVAYHDGAFLLRLKSKNKAIASGDLLSIYPANDHRERLYSIGKIDAEVQLIVKLHADGLGSGYLYGLQVGQTIQASIIRNSDFHFPKKASRVILISNGTGIAPFLGMLAENVKKTECHLYCGFRGKTSFEMYQNSLQNNLESGNLNQLHVAYSREDEKQYVKDLLSRDAVFIAETLKNNGVLILCGSLSMQQNVLELLEIICQQHHGKSVSFYQGHRQILMDCY